MHMIEIPYEEFDRLVTRDVVLESVIETFLTEEQKEMVDELLNFCSKVEKLEKHIKL